jgi:hypothetical protein
MKRYSNVLEVVVDCKKMKNECFHGFWGSLNDLKMLHKFSLYGHAQFQNLFDVSKGVHYYKSWFISSTKLIKKDHIMTFVNLINFDMSKVDCWSINM